MMHEGHLGPGKCKLHVKDTAYWPRINEQLEQLVLNHELCLKYSKAKGKQPSNKRSQYMCGQKSQLIYSTSMVIHIY